MANATKRNRSTPLAALPFHPCRSLAVLLFVLLTLSLQRSAAAQSNTQPPPADGPLSGPPPDGGPGGPPPSSSGSDASASSSSEGTGNNQRGNRPEPPSPAMELDRMTRAMKAANAPLTDAQKVAVLGILEDQETAMEALRTNTDRSSAMQQMQALQQSARTAILAVLSEAQQKIYAALRQGPPPRPGSNGSSALSNAGAVRYTAPVGDTMIDANTGGGISAPAR